MGRAEAGLKPRNVLCEIFVTKSGQTSSMRKPACAALYGEPDRCIPRRCASIKAGRVFGFRNKLVRIGDFLSKKGIQPKQPLL